MKMEYNTIKKRKNYTLKMYKSTGKTTVYLICGDFRSRRGTSAGASQRRKSREPASISQ